MINAARDDVMKVQVLGTGCVRCENLYNNAVEALGRLEGAAKLVGVEKVVNPEVFFRLKVSLTPDLAIDDDVISGGKVLATHEIGAELLERSVEDQT